MLAVLVATAIAAQEPPSVPPPEAPPIAAPAAAAPERRVLRVAVYDLAASGVDERMARIVTDAVLAEVRKLQRVSAVGMDEVRALLTLEADRQLLGCADESTCLAEVADALGVDAVVTGKLVALGDERVFGLRRIEREGVDGKGVEQRLEPAGGEEFLAAIGPAIAELFPDHPLRPGAQRGVDEAIALRLNPPPLPPWSFWTVASAAALAATAGAATGVVNVLAQAEFERLRTASTISYPALKERGDAVNATAAATWILLGGAAVGAVVAGFFVPFVGAGPSGALNDTWTFTGSSWDRLDVDAGMAGRQFPGMAYDVARDVIVVSGGCAAQQYCDPRYTDTWELDGDTWTDVTPTDRPNAPAHTFHGTFVQGWHALHWDDVAQRVVMIGDGTGAYEWTGDAWSPIPRTDLEGDLHDDVAYASAAVPGGGILTWNGRTWSWQDGRRLPPAHVLEVALAPIGVADDATFTGARAAWTVGAASPDGDGAILSLWRDDAWLPLASGTTATPGPLSFTVDRVGLSGAIVGDARSIRVAAIARGGRAPTPATVTTDGAELAVDYALHDCRATTTVIDCDLGGDDVGRCVSGRCVPVADVCDVAGAGGACGVGAYCFAGACTAVADLPRFLLVEPPATWSDARARCLSIGGLYDLAVLATDDDADALATDLGAQAASSWIGLTDAADEGVFAWVDGTPTTETRWNGGEPNDSGGAEDCVEVSATGTWNDVPCTAERTAVCER